MRRAVKMPWLALGGLAFILICAWTTSDLVAQQGTTFALVDKSARAYGLQLSDGRIIDWVGRGKIYMTGNPDELDFTVMSKGRNMIQRIVTGGGSSAKYGSDGKNKWQSSGIFSGTAVGRVLYFIESQTDRSIASLLANRSKGYPLIDLGPAEPDPGGAAASSRVVEAKNEKGQSTRYYIDDATALITRLEFNTGGFYTLLFNEQKYPEYATFVFSDYRNVDGIMTPFRIEFYQGQIKIEEMVFASVQYNTGVPDEAFAP